MDSDAFVRGIRGPVGSGKTIGACLETYRRICEQPDSRVAIVRNTYRSIVDTTLNSWMEYLRPYGSFKHSTMTWTHANGAEVLFRALDTADDVGKLLSLELTFAYVSEAKEVPRPIIDMLAARVGRYPAMRAGGAKWSGIILESNPSDTFHWWYRMFEETRPEGWEQFVQPGGRDPDAENIPNLPADYYDRISAGKDDAWVDVFVNGNYGFVVDGRPVYPQFKDRVHVRPCTHDPDLDTIVGLDFGLTPAAVFLQRDQHGQFRAIEEIVTEEFSAIEFADVLGEHLRTTYRHDLVEVWGDPSGDQRSQIDKRTAFQILKAAGIDARPAVTGGKNPNDVSLRVESVVRNLLRMTVTGEPGLIIDPSCRYLRRAMTGGYKFRLMQISGEERFTEHPEKNIYSHVAEALQYAMVGAGQARAVVGRDKRYREPLNYDRMDRGLI